MAGRYKLTLILLVVASIMAVSVFATSLPTSFVSFVDAEKTAVANSHQLNSQKFIVDSIKSQASAEKVLMLPSLSFGASSTFISKIGKINIPAMGITQNVGEHINWNAGPSVNWVVWDNGQIYNKSKSIRTMADSATNTLEFQRRQVVQNVRSAYINVQFAKEQVRLVKESLALAHAQYGYVKSRKDAGTADLLDLTVAHQEMVDREKDLEQANGALAVTKRVLVAAMGFDPITSHDDSLDVEPIGKVLGGLLPNEAAKVDVEKHPQAKALADKSTSSKIAAKSTFAGYFPKVTLQGTAAFQYPNLGQDETIQQNSLMMGLTFPIFEWGRIMKETRSYKYDAKSASEEREQTMIDLSRQTSAIREQITTLKSLRLANIKVVNDAIAVARLTFDSFKIGKVIFLDVQRANTKALATQVDSAQTDADLATQIVNLLALADEDKSEGGEK